MIIDEADEVIEEPFESILNRYQWEVVILFWILFIYCIINIIK